MLKAKEVVGYNPKRAINSRVFVNTGIIHVQLMLFWRCLHIYTHNKYILANIFIFRLLQFSHQWHKKQLPSIFDNCFRYASDVYTYNTRYASKSNFYKARYRTRLILEKQRFRLWQLTIGKNYHMLFKISIFPFSREKLNSIY